MTHSYFSILVNYACGRVCRSMRGCVFQPLCSENSRYRKRFRFALLLPGLEHSGGALARSKASAPFLFLLSWLASTGAGAQVLPAPQAVERILITSPYQREIPALDVAASVSVFTAEDLARVHVTTVKQLTSLAPTLETINSIGESFGQLFAVRGVARSGADLGLESPVGITVDGVPLLRPNLAIFDFQGVERIEFLRGPQGTLFGTNTTAGIINILTRRPDFTPHFEIAGTLGERDLRELRVSAEGALVPDKLAARIDGFVGVASGYLSNPNTGNVYGGHRRDELRGQLLWRLTDDVDVRLIADYLHHGGTVNSAVYRVVGPTGPIIARLSGLPLVASSDPTDLAQIDAEAPRSEFMDTGGVSAETNWGLGAAGTLTAIASYRSANFRRSYDVDNSPADIANDPRDGERYARSTGEMRFRGIAGRFDYLFGAFVSRGLIVSRDSYTVGHDFESYVNALAGGAIPIFTGLASGNNYPSGSGVFDVFRQRVTSYALFTHHIIALPEDLSLAIGARYTEEEKSLSASITSHNPGCASALALHGPSLSGVPAPLQGIICVPNIDPRYDGAYATSRNEGSWSGTAALSKKFTDWLNAYLNYSRGYKAGGFQFDRSGMDPLAPSLSQLAFEEESADSVEGGVKTASTDGAWRASTAIFRTTFNHYQFSYFTGLNRRVTNVPKLVTKGAEVEADYRLLQPLVLSFSGVYQEAIFADAGFPAGLTQLQGSTAPLAPRWVVVAGASFQQPFPELGITGFANAGVRWQSKANVGGSAAMSPDYLQKAYAVVDARIGADAREDHWRFELWARNLLNQRAWSILNSTTLQPGSISGYVTDPRSIGATATLFW
jgi:outer membrane receptor protein involved in Fe transport